MKKTSLLCLGLAFAGLTGCETVSEPHRASQDSIKQEGSLVFVRPDYYSILGTRSIRDYVEVTYEKASRNEAGLLMVETGLRNRGGQHFWDLHGPNFSLSVKTTFYKDPVTQGGPSGPPVYESNWQTVTLVRGDTCHFKAVCPVKDAVHYQVTVSEQLGR